MNRRFAVVVLGSLLAADSAAQNSEGLLVGMPAGAFVGTGTTSDGSPMSAVELHRKRAGFRPLAATSLPDAIGQPIFTASEMFNGGLGPPLFRVDALSIGQDMIDAAPPSGGVSVVTVQPHTWAVLAVSVTPASVGEAGSLIAEEVASVGGAAADVFTLTLPGSEIPPDVAGCYPTDVPQRALDASEMKLGGGAGGPDITSMDYQITLYESGAPLIGDLQPDPVVFFSVDSDSIFPPGGGPPLVPLSWFDCGVPSPATILKTRWIPNPGDPVKGGFWTPPRVHLSYDHLGLDPDDDIDALAVNRLNFMLIFSVKHAPGRNVDEQLQVARWVAGGTLCSTVTTVETGILVISTSGDVLVSAVKRLGLGPNDDIDTVCVVDPGSQVVMPLALGTPLGTAKPRGLSAQVYRDDDDPSGATLTFAVTGLPTSPPVNPTVIELWVFVPSWVPLVAFQAAAGFNGWSDHYERSITFPPLATLNPIGLEISSLWVMRETAGTFIKETSPTLAIDL